MPYQCLMPPLTVPAHEGGKTLSLSRPHSGLGSSQSRLSRGTRIFPAWGISKQLSLQDKIAYRLRRKHMLACKPMAARIELGALLHLLEEDASQEQAGDSPFLAILVEELFIRCEPFLRVDGLLQHRQINENRDRTVLSCSFHEFVEDRGGDRLCSALIPAHHRTHPFPRHNYQIEDLRAIGFPGHDGFRRRNRHMGKAQAVFL